MSYPLHTEYFSAHSDCPRAQYKPEHGPYTTFPTGSAPWDKVFPGGRARLISSSAPVLERAKREEEKREEEKRDDEKRDDEEEGEEQKRDEEEDTKISKAAPSALWRRHSLTDARILRPSSCWGSQYVNSVYEKEMEDLEKCFDIADKDKKNWINEDGLFEIYRMKKMNLSKETCKMLLNVFDKDCSGRMCFQDFAQVYKWTKVMQGAFHQVGGKETRDIGSQETVYALNRQGFSVDKRVLLKGINYLFDRDDHDSAPEMRMNFDSFMKVCALLGRIRTLFERQSPTHSGEIHLNLSQASSFVLQAIKK